MFLIFKFAFLSTIKVLRGCISHSWNIYLYIAILCCSFQIGHICCMCFVRSLRAAVLWQQCSVLPQAEPRPVSDRLPGAFCLWATHAVQQALYGKTLLHGRHIKSPIFAFSGSAGFTIQWRVVSKVETRT